MNLCIFDHHLIKKTTSTAWTSWEVENYMKYKYLKSTKNQLRSCTMKDISTILILTGSLYIFLQRMVTVDTKLRVFQYKILNNILLVNKMLFKLWKVESPLCSFCKGEDEPYIRLFYRCTKTSILLRQLQEFFSTVLDLP